MLAFKRTSLPLLLVLLGAFACAMPQVAVTDPGAAGTSVAQTVDAILILTRNAAGDVAEVFSETPTPLPTLTASATPEPTFTPSPTLTPTATPSPTPSLTATPLTPLISVSVPTNCRIGPGKDYEMVGALLVGETAQVYGRTAQGTYWYIRNPDSPGGFCWVWGEYATLSGLSAALPVYTPPPTPTPPDTATPAPAFEASYAAMDYCTAWWVDVRLENTGSLTFRSVSMTVRDTATDVVVTRISDGFTDENGCSSTERDKLLPGKHVNVSSPTFSYDVNDHKLKATLTLCSQTGLNGTCLTDTITFTP